MRARDRKVALVTGAARGVGRACALDLAHSGCDLALVDLLDAELERTAGAARAAGGEAVALLADVASYGRAGEVVGEVAARFGAIDVLVSNAGRSAQAGILEVTSNYNRHLAPVMLGTGGGRVVSMSSPNALSGRVTAAVSRFAYAAAKAVIIGIARALAKGLAPSVRVDRVCRGVDDVARLATFLATSEPCFLTGRAFTVDGLQLDV